MSLLEQFISGLLDERPNSGVRAVSWLLACAYVLTTRFWRESFDITVIVIEASAIVGIVRALYVLWTLCLSKNHRLHRLENGIGVCRRLARDETPSIEFLVRIIMLRDRLASLGLGLPKEELLSALEMLEVYAKERHWSMASDMFPSYMYGRTREDRDQEIGLLISRQPHVKNGEHWINRIMRYERARKRLQILRVTLVFAMIAYMAWFAVFLGGEGPVWEAMAAGVGGAVFYYWLLGYVSRWRGRSLAKKLEWNEEQSKEGKR